jgi:hypothetical protein
VQVISFTNVMQLVWIVKLLLVLALATTNAITQLEYSVLQV